MKVSIVMSVYNGEKFIEEQINSFLNQSYLPDEIIISDDCSSDNTLRILEKFKENKSTNIKIYQNKTNLGFTKNFESAISKSSGDVIFLSDQDDFWYKDKIKIIIDKFKSNPEKKLIIHDADLADEKLKTINITMLSQINSGFSNTDVFITGALTVFKKDLVDYFLPFPPNLLGHDGYIHCIARNLGTRMVINDKLQILRRHSTNTSNWIASSLKKINKFDVFKSHFFSKRIENYNDRLDQVKAVIKIIESTYEKKHSFSNQVLINSLNNLKNEKAALEKRNLFEGQNFIKKKIIAMDLLFSNQYKHFNGLKSFIRDLIR